MSPQTNPDEAMRMVIAKIAVPVFDGTPFVRPKPLSDATVAIVTSAALHDPDEERFVAGDTSYRVIKSDQRNLVLGHWSPNFDRTGIAIDLNVVFPIDRLDELALDGVIGAVAPHHYSFAGNQPDDVATVRLDSGPAVAAALLADGVDVVVLTPV
jgi:D-proline reductase (dithiol) PrdB